MNDHLITLEDVFTIFDEELSPFKILYERKQIVKLCLMPVALVILLAIIYYQYYQTEETLYFLFGMLLSFVALFSVNWYARKQLKRKGIPVSGRFEFWANKHYRKHKLKLFMEKLEGLGIVSDNSTTTKASLELLVSMAKKQAEVHRKTLPIKGGVFLVLFAPLWIQLLSWIYKSQDIKGLDEAWQVFVIISFMLMYICAAVYVIVLIIEDHMNSRSKRYFAFQTALEDILLNVTLRQEAVVFSTDSTEHHSPVKYQQGVNGRSKLVG